MKIALQITDQSTGHEHVIQVSMHDAQKLYMALRELVGDIQYQAQPGQLITLPDARVKI